ncbi:hypothetical protein [Microcoleus sp. N9_A1]|uniref:hypothetical protein n=1 Tax=Microcoleus sp. N9_A1 TaxID=3055380 RepID=UPI002FD49116
MGGVVGLYLALVLTVRRGKTKIRSHLGALRQFDRTLRHRGNSIAQFRFDRTDTPNHNSIAHSTF